MKLLLCFLFSALCRVKWKYLYLRRIVEDVFLSCLCLWIRRIEDKFRRWCLPFAANVILSGCLTIPYSRYFLWKILSFSKRLWSYSLDYSHLPSFHSQSYKFADSGFNNICVFLQSLQHDVIHDQSGEGFNVRLLNYHHLFKILV